MWDAATTPVRRFAFALVGLSLLLGGLTHASAGNGNPRPPKSPTNLSVADIGLDAVTLAWQAPKGYRQVASYGVYRDAALVGSTTETTSALTGLTCGTSYSLGVDVVDASGSRSAVESVVTSTASCPPADAAEPPPITEPAPPAPPAEDVSPPTAPTGLTLLDAGEAHLAFTWSTSQDDTGVTGYTAYVDAARAGTTAGTSFSAAGLTCGQTYRLAVDAYDAAGNLSAQTALSASTAACPPPTTVTCDRVASPEGSDSASGTLSAPFLTAQKLASSLASGQTGCLRNGRYSTSSTFVLELDNGGYRVQSYPGERATLVGNIIVRSSATAVTLSHFDIEGTGGSNTVKIYAADVVVEDNDITNLGRGQSCMMLGSNSGYGQATRTIVRRNRFHECGSLANDNKDHGIYAQNVADGEIVDNLFWNSAAYAIQLYPNAQRTRVANNVIDGDAPSVRGGILFGGNSSYASSDNVVEHNVIAYAETYNVTSTWSGAVGTGNLARENCVWAGTIANVNTSKGGFTATANLVADPLFLDRTGRDYRIGSTSPCIEVVGGPSPAG